MAYIVAGKGLSWEIRESQMTGQGPRSRTLTSFSLLTEQVVARAVERSSKPLDGVELERLARRAGAPVATAQPEAAARELLAGLLAGGQLRPVLSRLLIDSLGGQAGRLSHAAQAAAPWVGASLRERAGTLWDLLLLSDHLPPAKSEREVTFPQLKSTKQ